VGFILVIGLLVVPAATATLLTLRLNRMILLSVAIAALSAVLGHVWAKTLPGMIFGRLGLVSVEDAGTSGMMGAAAGAIFVLAFLFAPQQGVVGKLLSRLKLSLQIVGDDVLGELYRREELGLSSAIALNVQASSPVAALRHWLAVGRLARRGLVDSSGAALTLTQAGRNLARDLVRSHRLWESYMQKHFDVPDDHLHQTAHVVEHYIDNELQSRLAEELDSPGKDPHGKAIPKASEKELGGRN
jgi:manganese/zinc/iron transport system permease protein